MTLLQGSQRNYRMSLAWPTLVPSSLPEHTPRPKTTPVYGHYLFVSFPMRHMYEEGAMATGEPATRDISRQEFTATALPAHLHLRRSNPSPRHN